MKEREQKSHSVKFAPLVRKVMFLPENAEEIFGDNHYIIPKDCGYFQGICYKDGSPVVFKYGEPFTIKCGKRKFANVTIIKE